MPPSDVQHMRTHKPPVFHKQSTGSQELPVLTYLLSPTNPTAPASHTVEEGVTWKAFLKLSWKVRLLRMKVTLVLMSSGTTLGVPMPPFPLWGRILQGLDREIRNVSTLPLSSLFPQYFQDGLRKSFLFFFLSAQDLSQTNHGLVHPDPPFHLLKKKI